MSLLLGMDQSPVKDPAKEKGCWSFQDPCADRLTFGEMLLSDYLSSSGLGWVVHLTLYLQSLDWGAFRASYNPRGRRPLHPRIMVGLVVYGFGQGIHSLRGLEELASRDLAAIYLCGGVRPDHSTIGKFILRHGSLLEETLFEQTLLDITARLGLCFDEVSGDGTVVQAWGSHYRALEKEALEEKQQRVEKQREIQPDNEALSSQAEALAQAAEVLGERVGKKEAAGKSGSKTKIHPGEPEAVYQKQKDKTCRFSYKPVILTSPDRLIVGQTVEPSAEAQGLAEILVDFEARRGQRLGCVMLDAGFLTQSLLAFGLDQEVDLLIPSGCAERGDWEKQPNKNGRYGKLDFHYDESTDTYRCPAGRRLELESEYVDNQGRRVHRYRCRKAASCKQKERCTTSSRGRTIKRYEADEIKEGMRQVMAQPGARSRYRKRAGMVEPVFGHLRYNQGLQRFRRKGLAKVRLEFALHAIAYNLGRAFRIMGMVIGAIKDPHSGARTYFYVFFHLQV